jgi:hypothetical protein
MVSPSSSPWASHAFRKGRPGGAVAHRPHAVESTRAAVLLWSHDDVAQNRDAILARRREGTMPCDGAWPDDQVALLQRWVDAGTPP